MQVSRSRGHAWPEFALGHGGMTAGALVGALLCGGESCFATPLSIGLGGLTGVVLATAIFGTDDSDSETRSMPLMLLYF